MSGEVRVGEVWVCILFPHMSVRLAVWMQGLDPFDFAAVFGEVGLHRHAFFASQLAKLSQKLTGACGHKSGHGSVHAREAHMVRCSLTSGAYPYNHTCTQARTRTQYILPWCHHWGDEWVFLVEHVLDEFAGVLHRLLCVLYIVGRRVAIHTYFACQMHMGATGE